MEGSLVNHKRAKKLFLLAGYNVEEAVSIQRGGNLKDIEALLSALGAIIETVVDENDLRDFMYMQSTIAMLLE